MAPYCRVTWADVSCLAREELWTRYYERMPALRRAKADRFIFPEGRRLSLGAGILLGEALTAAGIDPLTAEIREGEFGKPFLPGFPEVHFNLSHAGDLVLCALSCFPVGCDVEQTGRGSLALARRFFTPEEADFLEAEKDEARMQQLFCRIWVRKESYIKAKGKGLALPLNAFSVLPLTGGPLRFYEPEMPEGYRAACLLLTEEEAAFTCSRTDLTAGF